MGPRGLHENADTIEVRMMHQVVGRGIGMTLALVILAAEGTSARAEDTRLADYFGFLPLEIYKLDTRISNLLLEDLDGDGTRDIVVVNNGRSRIDLLLSSKSSGDAPGAGARSRSEPNEVA